MELFQAEWCPHSHAVRQRLTELGLDFTARQVPADPKERDELERIAGTNEIPVLVADAGLRTAATARSSTTSTTSTSARMRTSIARRRRRKCPSSRRCKRR